MPRKYIKKRLEKTKVSEDEILSAIAKVKKKELSIRQAAKEIGLPESTLRDKMKRKRSGSWGGVTTLPKEAEERLALMLSVKAKWGFAASKAELKDIIQEFVSKNKEEDSELGEQLRKFNRFKVNK